MVSFFLFFSCLLLHHPKYHEILTCILKDCKFLLQEMADGGCVLVLGVLGTAIEQLGEMVCLSIFMSLEVAPKH